MNPNTSGPISRGFQSVIVGFVMSFLALCFSIMIWMMVDAVNLTGEHKELAIVCIIKGLAGIIISIIGYIQLKRQGHKAGMVWLGLVFGLIAILISGLNHQLLTGTIAPEEMVHQIEQTMDTTDQNNALDLLNQIIPDSTSSNQ